MNIQKREIKKFQNTVRSYYRKHGRHDLPWRTNASPYRVLVSEVMLQQTQVPRVLIKFAEFIKVFPTVQKLATSDTSTLLKTWQGLGYNRRALWLREAAIQIVKEWKGKIPSDPSELENLKGIGHYTARAIAAFAFDIPSTFIETNIRRVYLHHFFSDRVGVPDTELMPIIEATLDTKKPRQWYWALMDYGAHLAKTIPNPNKRSRHYSVQSKFQGSQRQLRARILWLVTEKSRSFDELLLETDDSEERLGGVLATMESEGFLKQSRNKFILK
jgi:A/G-specific adenine glycosylase